MNANVTLVFSNGDFAVILYFSRVRATWCISGVKVAEKNFGKTFDGGVCVITLNHLDISLPNLEDSNSNKRARNITFIFKDLLEMSHGFQQYLQLEVRWKSRSFVIACMELSKYPTTDCIFAIAEATSIRNPELFNRNHSFITILFTELIATV
jgi:hypothetical protein